jgi:hypothetical protein
VCYDDHDISMWEGYELDVGFSEGYGYMRPFCSCVWSYHRHMVKLVVAFAVLLFVLEVPIGSFGNFADGSECWEIDALLQPFRVLWWWRRQSTGLYFLLDYLSVGCRICYLQRRRRVRDGRLSRIILACGRGLVVWLVIR